jgi:hypothetical protein
MDKIMMNREYETRKGHFKVRMLCIDGPNSLFPVVGTVEGNPNVLEWTAEGIYNPDVSNHFDLIPVPTKHEGWMFVSIEGNPVGNIYPTEKEAEDWAASIWQWHLGFIYLSHVTWES